MQSEADREAEGSIWFCAFYLFFFSHAVPHQDYSQGGCNLQQGLILLWVLLLMTFNKKPLLRGRGNKGFLFFSARIY